MEEKTNNLTCAQLNLKVAKIMGWRFHQHNWASAWHDALGDGPPPDFSADLNAMHEAEKMIPLNLLDIYTGNLSYEIIVANKGKGESAEWKMWHTTAEQRARAFVKTMESTPTGEEDEKRFSSIIRV